ncbi:MAG: hypothetical protein QG599_3375 [Pseudomonadota bacterium]|nr:hypothetical protein [Pseudomonadota bacterium]
MIVTFKSRAHADILMFGDIAVSLLKLMGHSGTVPGALQAGDIPEALDHLKKALAINETVVADASDPVEEEESGERTINLLHRALPLIELLTASVTAKCDVMWDQ